MKKREMTGKASPAGSKSETSPASVGSARGVSGFGGIKRFVVAHAFLVIAIVTVLLISLISLVILTQQGLIVYTGTPVDLLFMLFIFVLFLTCLLLIGQGLYGDKVNGYRCASCGYDLRGLVAQNTSGDLTFLSKHCPECGTEIMHSSLIHHRKRSPECIRAGAVLSLLTIAYIGIFQIGNVIDISGLRTYKPLWLLEMELNKYDAERGETAEAKNALNELTLRMARDTLSDRDVQRAVDILLKRQADAIIPWQSDWDDFIAEAQRKGQMTESQLNKYLENGLGIQMKIAGQAHNDLDVHFNYTAIEKYDKHAIQWQITQVQIGGASLNRAMKMKNVYLDAPVPGDIHTSIPLSNFDKQVPVGKQKVIIHCKFALVKDSRILREWEITHSGEIEMNLPFFFTTGSATE